MYIEDIDFYDLMTLVDTIYEFRDADMLEYIIPINEKIWDEINANEKITAKVGKLDEVDRMDYAIDEHSLRLAQALIVEFDSFAVRDWVLYGCQTKGDIALLSMARHK